jgi:hypothetical protein
LLQGAALVQPEGHFACDRASRIAPFLLWRPQQAGAARRSRKGRRIEAVNASRTSRSPVEASA